MNNSSGAKTAVIKTLAIVGFLATIGLLAWLFIQGLRVVPGAFASLASLAESLQSYSRDTELTIATEKSVIVSDEQFKLAWTDLRMDGTYEFGYACTDGISLGVQGDGEVVIIPCTQALSLPADVHGLFVSIHSENDRFVDVPLTVSFKREDGEVLVESDTTVTVVNATIPLANLPETTPSAQPTPTSTPEVVESPIVAVPEPAPLPTPTPAQKPPTTIVYTPIPTSNPAGNVDLKISYLGVGEMNGTTFSPSARFDRSERNGLKFDVKNIGTKTSGTWTFTAVLPGDITYTSPVQTALLPGERIEFTLGFDMDEDDTAKQITVKATVAEKNDSNTKNNSFSWVVEVTK